jgi:hypothetical protein
MVRLLDTLALLSNEVAANSDVDTSIDSPLEYYFGGLALLALVMTWAWLWMRLRENVKAREALTAREPEDEA